MAKTLITIQSTKKADLDLFFQLLGDRVGRGKQEWDKDGNHTCMFTLNFKELQRVVTNAKGNVTKKQDLSINKELIKRVKRYRKSGLSFQKVADKLNSEGFKNSRGNKLNRMQVCRMAKM